MASSWRVRWARRWDEVWSPEFHAAWDARRRADPAANVYHTPAFAQAWSETLGDALAAEPLFGMATDDEGREVVLPWVVIPSRGRILVRRTAEGVGGDMAGYHDPIVAGGPAGPLDWDALWRACRQTAAGSAHQLLLRSVRAEVAGSVFTFAANPSPILTLSGAASLAQLLARCSANHRGDVRRRFRRLSEQGDIHLWVAGDDALGYPDAFEDFCAAYGARQQVRTKYPSFNRPGLADFWRRVATTGVAEGWGHFAALFVGSRPVAWHLGLLDRGDFYWWVPAHAHELESFSPGKVLLAALIEHGLGAGWRAVHFQTGGQAYKMAWRPDMPDRRTIRWHANTLAGSLLAQYDRAVAVLA